MSDSTILLDAFKQKPAAAIEYIKAKGFGFSWDWFDMWKDAHARAFTVAKVAKLDLLKDIRNMVEKAIADGITFQQFKKELMPTLQKKGWWGKKEIVNKETGEVSQYMAGSPRRLETIYKTNVQTAYMAGRYKGQMEAAGDLPYMQYIAVNDRRTRDGHRELHGLVFKADDPFWNEFYPPNGWGCRCRVRSLTERQVQRMGVDVESSADKIVHGEQIIGKGDKAKKVAVTGYRLPSGKVMTIGAGWDYNAGKSAFVPDLKQYHVSDVTQFKKDIQTLTESGNDSILSNKESKVLSSIQDKVKTDWREKANTYTWKIDAGDLDGPAGNLAEFESIIKNAKKEIGVVFDKNGNFITARGGKRNRTFLLPSKEMRDTICTHNHPSGNASFSRNDIRTALTGNVQEMRVVTSDGAMVRFIRGPNARKDGRFLISLNRFFPADNRNFTPIRHGRYQTWLKLAAQRHGYIIEEGST